jgi:hypothetical protein
MEESPRARQGLFCSDLAIFALPALLLALEIVRRPWLRPGKLSFLASVCGMYGALLWAVMTDQKRVILGLVAASAAFHAIEYLAVVSHYAQRRRTQGAAGCFATCRDMGGGSRRVRRRVRPRGKRRGWFHSWFWLGLILGRVPALCLRRMIWNVQARNSRALGVEIPEQSILRSSAPRGKSRTVRSTERRH